MWVFAYMKHSLNGRLGTRAAGMPGNCPDSACRERANLAGGAVLSSQPLNLPGAQGDCGRKRCKAIQTRAHELKLETGFA